MANGAVSGGVVKLYFDGTELSASIAAAVISARVDQRLNVPAMCTVSISPMDDDPQSATPLDLETFQLGTDMRAEMGLQNANEVFNGQIAALEPNYGESCREIEITGYDHLLKLEFGTKVKKYENLTDSMIASQVIEDNGLAANVDATEGTYPYVLQNNISDYKFIMSRAARLAYEVIADGRTIYFRKTRAGQDSVASLEYGATLSKFTARMRVLKQGSQATRVGWDPKTKQVITASVSSGTPDDRMGGEESGFAASQDFAASPMVVPDASVVDAEIAQSAAKGDYQRGLDGFIEGTAVCAGNPAIKPGVNVSFSKISSRFDGLYYVTAARHSYDRDNGYVTEFEVRRTGI